MTEWIVRIISVLAAWGVYKLITLKRARGNEFRLHRIYYVYGNSNRSVTAGIFSSKAKAEEKLKEIQNNNAAGGLTFGMETIGINTYKGREGNLAYEWKRNGAEPMGHYFFTREENLEELKNSLKNSNNGVAGEFNSYEIDRLCLVENGDLSSKKII